MSSKNVEKRRENVQKSNVIIVNSTIVRPILKIIK